MNSYEVTTAAIEFKYPNHIPVIADMLKPDFNGDVVAVYANKPPQTAENVDQWGCVWEHTDVENMGMVKEILIKRVEDIANFKDPDPSDEKRYEMLAPILNRAKSLNKYVVYNGVINDNSALFDRMHWLHGFEQTLMDIIADVEFMDMLANVVITYHLRQIDYVSKKFGSLIHGYRMSDDWGTQHKLLISPKTWNQFIAPRYKVIFDRIHEAKWHVWLHSCGHINEILLPLRNVGLNVVNIQSPHQVGIEEAGHLLRNNLCVETWCDIQRTLNTGTARQIEDEVSRIFNYWSTKNGGLVFRLINETQAHQAGIPVEATRVMADAINRISNNTNRE